MRAVPRIDLSHEDRQILVAIESQGLALVDNATPDEVHEEFAQRVFGLEPATEEAHDMVEGLLRRLRRRKGDVEEASFADVARTRLHAVTQAQHGKVPSYRGDDEGGHGMTDPASLEHLVELRTWVDLALKVASREGTRDYWEEQIPDGLTATAGDERMIAVLVEARLSFCRFLLDASTIVSDALSLWHQADRALDGVSAQYARS